MSRYVFRRKAWRKWKLESKLEHMRNVVMRHDDRVSLINNKHYFGFGYCNHLYSCDYYINEEVIGMGLGYKNEVRTQINIFLGYSGVVHITKEKVSDPNINVLYEKKLIYDDNNQEISCVESKHVKHGTSVWKCVWDQLPMLRDIIPIFSCGEPSCSLCNPEPLLSLHKTTDYFDCLDFAIEYYKVKVPLPISNYPTRYGKSVPSLKQLSSFILLHSHFPFLDTILRNIIPKQLFKWILFEYPAQAHFLQHLYTHLGICVE